MVRKKHEPLARGPHSRKIQATNSCEIYRTICTSCYRLIDGWAIGTYRYRAQCWKRCRFFMVSMSYQLEVAC